MIRLYLEFILLLVIFCSCNSTSSDVERKYLHLSKADLENKIKGGWAGQTIGVTFGGVTEFKFNGTFIQDYQPLPWNDNQIKNTMLSWPVLMHQLTHLLMLSLMLTICYGMLTKRLVIIY